MKRKKIKIILCHMAIITICAGVFCHGYINGLSISKYDRFYSYAEADNWSSCDSSDLVTAFRYYCKSRNLAIEGSLADALTTFTTTTFNNICSKLGIDPTQLQAELKKTTSGNLGLRFLFSQTGITAYNRIFAEFLQNNDLEVGEEVEDKILYSGKYINGSLVYYINAPAAADNLGTVTNKDFSPADNSYITLYGTSINDTDFVTVSPWNKVVACNFVNYTANCNVYNRNISIGGTWNYIHFFYPLFYSDTNGFNSNTEFPIRNDGNNPEQPLLKSHACYVHFSDGNLMPCIITFTINNKFCIRQLGFNYKKDTENVKDTDITVTTNNNTINNNTYNNNYTIIYNDGDTYYTDDDDEPGPETPPGGGGGGGGGGDPDNWNPTTPTIPSPTNPNFPTVNLPDIDIPDLPSLNFSLGDLRNKFPFSLPFDIIAVLNVLDGEPQAPHIEATVPIGKWYTWEMDFDFSEFDNYARIFRAFEFIGFCIGLAVFTVHFVKG